MKSIHRKPDPKIGIPLTVGDSMGAGALHIFASMNPPGNHGILKDTGTIHTWRVVRRYQKNLLEMYPFRLVRIAISPEFIRVIPIEKEGREPSGSDGPAVAFFCRLDPPDCFNILKDDGAGNIEKFRQNLFRRGELSAFVIMVYPGLVTLVQGNGDPVVLHA